MELIKCKSMSELAAEKIAQELKDYKGDRYGQAVKDFVASTLTNFCQQDERFAQVVFHTEATLSDCCSKIMKGCGSHISDIDVYRGAVRYYFPNAEIQFTMTIDASGEMPTDEEMAKPEPNQEAKPATKAPARPKAAKPEKKKAGPYASKKTPVAPPEGQQAKPVKQEKKKEPKQEKDDGIIQLSLF